MGFKLLANHATCLVFATLLFLAAATIHYRTIQAAENAEETAARGRNQVALEALKRLKGIELDSNPAVKKAVLKVLEGTRGTPAYVEIVKDFNLKNQNQGLLEVALAHLGTSASVEALRLILQDNGQLLLREALHVKDEGTATQLAKDLGDVAHPSVPRLLKPLLASREDVPPSVQKAATRALANSEEGARWLLDLAEKDELPSAVKLAATMALHQTRWENMREKASELLPLPQSRNAEPLPPISKLVEMEGDPERGAKVFRSELVGCNRCHQVKGEGIDFGPALTEIGTKLGKGALFESILDPSAGISFDYEAWELELKNGESAFGLIVSETEDVIALKTQTGTVTEYRKNEIANRRKMKTSIMPAGLQMAMTTQELVDLVAYLSTLKK